jgi:hypothetical protein
MYGRAQVIGYVESPQVDIDRVWQDWSCSSSRDQQSVFIHS